MAKTFNDLITVAKRLRKNGFKENLTNSIDLTAYKGDLITLVDLFEKFIAESEGGK